MLKKITVMLSAMLLALMPVAVYADAEDAISESEPVIAEENVADTEPEATEETATEIASEPVPEEEITEPEEVAEDVNEPLPEPVAEEESAEDFPESFTEEPETEVLEEDDFDEYYFEDEEEGVDEMQKLFDIAFARVRNSDDLYVDIRDLKIPVSEEDNLAGTLSVCYSEFYLEEEDGYIVAVIFDEIDNEDEKEVVVSTPGQHSEPSYALPEPVHEEPLEEDAPAIEEVSSDAVAIEPTETEEAPETSPIPVFPTEGVLGIGAALCAIVLKMGGGIA